MNSHPKISLLELLVTRRVEVPVRFIARQSSKANQPGQITFNRTDGLAILRKAGWLLLLAITLTFVTSSTSKGAANVVIWDTGTPLSGIGEVPDRSGWKIVPSDLFELESNPAKASSDPGYYGREYLFKGDVVVENATLLALFSSAKGRVALFSKSSSPFQKITEVSPIDAKQHPATINHSDILQNVRDQAVVEVSFSSPGAADRSARFSFDKTGIVEIKPGDGLRGVSLSCPIAYGVVPGFVGDDLIFGAAEHASGSTLSIPSANIFAGLLNGENAELVLTWPKGKQRMRLGLGEEDKGKKPIESIEFENDAQSLYLAPIAAPGIWHREALGSSFLEKDVPLRWKKPFSATWKTQLTEEKVRTTFAFREAKGSIWRGVPGSYEYPVWFDGDTAFYHLSKKVAPKGESIIYFLEGDDTPVSIATPVEILEATLGRQAADEILDAPGRKLRTHHRRGGSGVRRACTCGCTEAIQAVFEAGEEVAKKGYIDEAVGDMIYFIQRHMERIAQYKRFADDMTQFLAAQAQSVPELKPLTEQLSQIVSQIPEEYAVQQENMKSLAYAQELHQQTMALTGKKETNNLASYMDLLKAWRGMGGAQDYVLAQCHGIARKLFQEAGYASVNEPKAVELVAEVRKRCQECLRNPDGYEIWPNY